MWCWQLETMWNTAGTSFYRFPLLLVLFCSTIATNYAYEFAKACAQWLLSYVTWCWKPENMPNTTGTSFYRFSFVLVLFCSTIATNYAYKFPKACAQSLSSYVTWCWKQCEILHSTGTSFGGLIFSYIQWFKYNICTWKKICGSSLTFIDLSTLIRFPKIKIVVEMTWNGNVTKLACCLHKTCSNIM